MKARIPQDQEDAIYDYIYLILLFEILAGKADNGLNLDKVIKMVLNELTQLKEYLLQNRIKIHPAVPDPDGEFVSYYFTKEINGGFQEGHIRFWRKALRNTLNKKMKLLENGETIADTLKKKGQE